MNSNSVLSNSKLMPVMGMKIYKIDESQWQIVTPSSAQTIKCPELLMKALVDAFGKHSREEFIDDLADHVEQKVSAQFLDALIDRGAICSREVDQALPLQDSLFSLLPTANNKKHTLAVRPSEQSLKILGSGCLYSATRRMAVEAGFALIDGTNGGAIPTMILVVSDTQNHDWFREVNREQVVPSRVPAIFSYIDGASARLFRVVPGATACFECLHHRMRVGKSFFREFDAASSGKALWFQDALPSPGLQAQQLAATTLIQASQMLANSIQDLHESYLIELLALNEIKRKSSILKLPRCEVCGPGNTSRAFPPIYNPASIQN